MTVLHLQNLGQDILDAMGGEAYQLPVATTTTLGGVKPDGVTIKITADGVISTEVADLSLYIKTVNTTITPDSNGNIVLTADNLNAYTKPEVNTELDKKINKTDIADNLTTDDSTKVLSAKQAVELKKLIDNLPKPKTGEFTTTVNNTVEKHYVTSIDIQVGDQLDVYYNGLKLLESEYEAKVIVTGEKIAIKLNIDQSTNDAENVVTGRIYRGFDSI